MPTVAEAFNAGIDAVIADNTINRGAFVDAMQTVITRGLSNAEGNAFVDAVATEYERVGLINNPTYNNLRNNIANAGADASKALFSALTTLNAVPEAQPLLQAAGLMDLREDRDSINATLDRIDALIAAEPNGPVGRLVKQVLREGKDRVREYRQAVRDQIQNLTDDPDS